MPYPTKRTDNSAEVQRWFDSFYETFVSGKGDFSRVINQGFNNKIIGSPKNGHGTGFKHGLHVIRGGSDYYEKRQQNLEEVVIAIKLFAYVNPELSVRRIAELKKTMKHHQGINATLPAVETKNPMTRIAEIQRKKDLLQIKLDVILHWINVIEDNVRVDYSAVIGDADQQQMLLKHHELLNASMNSVKTILELMVADAHDIVGTSKVELRSDLHAGFTANGEFKITKEFLNFAIQARASSSYGVKCSGEMELRYNIPAKITATGEAFAGIRGEASAELIANAEKISVGGEISAEMGVVVSGNLAMDFDYLLSVEAGGKAIAGALAKAEAKFTIDGKEISAKAAAEVFAGLKVEGEVKAGFKYDGNTFMTWTGSGSASLGVGASAECKFACGVFGDVSVGAEGGVTLGTGATLGAEVSINTGAMASACEQIYFDGMHHLVGYNASGRRHFIQPNNNRQMAEQAIQAISQLRVRLVMEQSELHEFELIDAWNARLEKLGFDSAAKRLATMQ